MNRFQILFQDTKAFRFIPFFMLGYPNIESSFAVIKTAIDNGASALELGIPFSDPIADGPVIQRAAQHALQAGVNFAHCMALLKRIREYAPNIPIGLLLYYNLIYRRGIANAYQEFSDAGVDAILVVDLPLEESAEHEQLLKTHGLGNIQLIAPNTPMERANILCEHSSAFNYIVSTMGTTGVRKTLDPRLIDRLCELRKLTDKPLVVGFGISEMAHIKILQQQGANAAIVGSALIKIIEEHQDNLEKTQQKIAAFIQPITAQLKLFH